MMSELIPALDKEAIARIVADLGRRISSDYKNRELVVIGVLKGAFVFLADLIRKIDGVDLSVDFVRTASYGSDSESSGQIQLSKDIEVEISGKDVLIVEDILDSGLTAAYLMEFFRQRKPKSIKFCAFIDKQERRQVDLQADYVGFSVERGFLVGYGLDYAEQYRNLPGVYELKLT